MTIIIDKSYYIGTSPYSFRSGEAAEIISVVDYSETREDGNYKITARPCFYIRYADGFEDYAPISDISNYKIVSRYEIIEKFLLKGV